MSGQPTGDGEHLEVSTDEVLRQARPYPPREELVIDDLTDDEEDAFWDTVTE